AVGGRSTTRTSSSPSFITTRFSAFSSRTTTTARSSPPWQARRRYTGGGGSDVQLNGRQMSMTKQEGIPSAGQNANGTSTTLISTPAGAGGPGQHQIRSSFNLDPDDEEDIRNRTSSSLVDYCTTFEDLHCDEDFVRLAFKAARGRSRNHDIFGTIQEQVGREDVAAPGEDDVDHLVALRPMHQEDHQQEMRGRASFFSEHGRVGVRALDHSTSTLNLL
ncbi:unnamed protein product, partial [Amoebophrya sp. A25]